MQQPFTTASPTLVNYDFSDILTDVGYVSVFAMIDQAGNEKLVRQTIESNEPKLEFDVSIAGLQDENNFDFEFRAPVRLDGLCYFTVTYFARAQSTQTVDSQVKLRLIHVSTGAVETEIAAQQSSDLIQETRDSSTSYDNVTFSFDINQAFAKGDKFRLELQIHSQSTTNAQVGYFVDPANRDFGQVGLIGAFESTITPSSQLEVLLPFPLEQ